MKKTSYAEPLIMLIFKLLLLFNHVRIFIYNALTIAANLITKDSTEIKKIKKIKQRMKSYEERLNYNNISTITSKILRKMKKLKTEK